MSSIASRRRGRGLLQRPFLLFGVLLLLPALAFGLLGWTSVLREHSLAEREAAAEAEEVVERRVDAVAGDVWAIEAREAERPYFHYQRFYAPEDTTFQQLDFQPSPLLKAAEDPRVLGWFQWELGVKGVPTRPEAFAVDPAALNEGLAREEGILSYATYLRDRLQKAASGADHLLARRVDHPLRVVQANEERGQLYEEFQIVRQQQQVDAPDANVAAPTSYLANFLSRVGEEPVAVRYGSFRYVARVYAKGIPLVAWRLVWIPASHADRREVRRDRWLLQGYALAPGRSFPTKWQKVGNVRVCRADQVWADVVDAPHAATASLFDLLDVDRISGPGVVAIDPYGTLTLAALPDQEAIDAAGADARARFFWLLAGVVVVVVVGFVVLTRGLRREVALARRKEDFLAAVTHELKTPLTGIRMYADMLKEGWVADADSATRYASRIGEESDRLGHLVDQVLDFAAWERGMASADLRPGDLAATVREAVRLVESRAEQAGVALELEVDPDLPDVRFDGRLLKPLVLNLLDNAIKYSENAAEKDVTVRVHRDDEHVVLEVADRGVGIDAKVQKHLFEPFQRAGDELTRSSKGVGIGLALVKRYAEAHGATVRLESRIGEGTTVRVRFPA